MEIMVMFLWVNIYLQTPHVVYFKYIQLFYMSHTSIKLYFFLKNTRYKILPLSSMPQWNPPLFLGEPGWARRKYWREASGSCRDTTSKWLVWVFLRHFFGFWSQRQANLSHCIYEQNCKCMSSSSKQWNETRNHTGVTRVFSLLRVELPSFPAKHFCHSWL